jgi:hypothetical protein
MERWRDRQTNLFERSPETAALPEALRQKALLLLGSLLTEAPAMQNGNEKLDRSREGGHDQDHC